MDTPEKKAPTPPYVAYKTLSNFLDRFKQGLPGRIDRGLMGSMSGAAQSQVTTALRFLGMISENNIPNHVMKRYVSGEEAERKAALREMLEKSYPFIFRDDFALHCFPKRCSSGCRGDCLAVHIAEISKKRGKRQKAKHDQEGCSGN